MAIYGDELEPPLAELEAAYPISEDTERRIAAARAATAQILSRDVKGFVVIAGPCSMPQEANAEADLAVLAREGDQLYEMGQAADSGLAVLHRLPPWKPRTRVEDWHGRESQPETVVSAYTIVAERTAATANLALEFGHPEHFERYGHFAILAWVGARNDGNGAMRQAAIGSDPTMSIGVKNGTNGDAARTLACISEINVARGAGSAPAVLVFRGGDNMRDPGAWEKAYREALDQTGGRVIVDVAHGGEMAHDQEGTFRKSWIGQLLCAEHVMLIGRNTGEMPVGVMMETSNAPTPTDPVVPFELGRAELWELVTTALR